MTEVISVRFKNKGKIYFFDPNNVAAEKGDYLVVETAKGLEYAECVRGNHEVDDASVIPPLRPVIRIATPQDIARAEENKKKEAEALEICRDKIEKHGLEMKLVDVEYNFEGNKILFFFTSDGRVDFRDLVKDLAGVFKTRIELRQIGIRDEARMLGGLGICGKPFCCTQFLDDFQPVSIKMAKTQGLSLNPTKISGTCGRLMCCLKYEQNAYEDLVKNVPKVDAFVDTPAGKGSVIDVNLLRSRVRVKLADTHELTIKTFEADEVEVLGGKAARAEYEAAKADGRITPPVPPRRQPAERPRPAHGASQKPRPDAPPAAQPPRSRNNRKGQNPGRTQRPQQAEKPPQNASALAVPRDTAADTAQKPKPRNRRRRRGGSKRPAEGGQQNPQSQQND